VARADCIVNRIADGIVTALRRIDSTTTPDDWHTKPVVKRGFLMADLTGPFPVALVQLARWGDDVPISGESHDGKAVFYIHCISSRIEDSERGLNQLAADVIRAIAHDEALSNSAIEGFVDIYPKYYEPQTEAMEKIGLGITTVVVEATFQWSHDAP
jgi:hypothetical protein